MRRTYGRTDESNAYCPLPYGRGHNKAQKLSLTVEEMDGLLKMTSDWPLSWLQALKQNRQTFKIKLLMTDMFPIIRISKINNTAVFAAR